MIFWAICATGGSVGALWVWIVAAEFRRLRQMNREAEARLREAEKTRKLRGNCEQHP